MGRDIKGTDSIKRELKKYTETQETMKSLEDLLPLVPHLLFNLHINIYPFLKTILYKHEDLHATDTSPKVKNIFFSLQHLLQVGRVSLRNICF